MTEGAPRLEVEAGAHLVIPARAQAGRRKAAALKGITAASEPEPRAPEAASVTLIRGQEAGHQARGTGVRRIELTEPAEAVEVPRVP